MLVTELKNQENERRENKIAIYALYSKTGCRVHNTIWIYK